MNKQLRFVLFILFLICATVRPGNAQSTFSTEEELKQQALKLFEDDEFEEAFPLYSQLVSLYPKDPNYNYRLGVCMLYASDDKEKAITFLDFASKKPEVEKEVFFYLAKAYHLNYRFDDAISKYMAYQKVASEAKANKLQVDRQIEMCRNGKKLLRNITDLVVIDKKELSKADFYRAYDISDIGGKLLAKPDEDSFKTPLDKKKKEKSIIYLASNNSQIFFSSYGDDIEHGKDIFVIRKLPNGEWSKPQTLGYPVNTEYDEDFPFLHPNGKVLYFCSKGQNSMGGYDIFKTTLNEETNTWNKPVNLDFPINTPDDDILYVTNEDEKEAYFSSARSSKIGKTAVYHINVERRPIEVAIIKGAVVKNRDNQALDVKITIKDLGDNTILGIYNSKPESGSYLINLPNGGKFMYTVEATGFSTQSEVVELPTQYEFKPLKQEISYETGTDKLLIKNLFDEPADEQSYLLALNFIKEKSKLEASTNDASSSVAAKSDNATNNSNGQNTVPKTEENTKTNVAPTKLSNDDIIKIAYDDAKEAEKEAKDLQEQADIALNLANQKNELAQSKNKEASQLLTDASSITDNIKKQTALDEANQARTDAEELNQETVAAFNIAKKIGMKAAAKDEEADLSLQYAKNLEAAIKSKDPLQALTKLQEQEKKLEALSEKNGMAEPDNIFAGLKMDSENKKRELDKAIQISADIKQEIADNETLITSLQAEADKTKKEDLKKGLLDQIEGLKADNEQSKKDLAANDLKISKNLKEFNGIKNEMELVNNVVDKSKTGTNEDAAASVATIDKSKLEAQVNEIKTTSDAAPDNKDVSTEVAKYNNESKTSDIAVNSNPENKTDVKSADAVNNSDSTTETNTTKVDYNKQFTDQVSETEKITDPLERENKKAELYKELTANISNELTQKKQEVKAEKDKDKKKALNSEIALLEKDLKEKQVEEQVILAKVDKLKTEASLTNNSAENKSSDNSTGVAASKDINTINESFNTQLAEVDKISNEADKENAKADLLQKWATAIDSNIEKQKKDFISTTDPKLKTELAQQISAAETVSKEKKSLADESLAKANSIKNEQSTIATNNNENKTNNSVSDNTVSNSQSISTINKTFNDQLGDADKIPNELERENTKADLLQKWSAAIENNIVQQKNELAITTDPELKALLAKQITEAENASAEKKSLANVSVTKADALKNSQGTMAVNANDKTNSDDPLKTPTQNSSDIKTEEASNLSPIQKLDNSIVLAQKSGTELDRENKKKDAYENFITDENQLLIAKEASLKSEKNQAKKKELAAEISSINSEIKEKQKLLDDANTRITALSEQTAIVDNSTIENNKKPSTASGYTNSNAIEKSKAADIAKKESEDLKTQANDLKIEAAEKSSQSEKDALLVKANDLIKQADVKEIQSTQLFSDANQAEFLSNKNELDQLAVISTNNSSDEIAMAEMMKDESVIYFARAKQSKDLAANTSLNEDRIAALTDALTNENIALEKQKRSISLYKKNNPGFVAKTGIQSNENDVTTNVNANLNTNVNTSDVTQNNDSGTKSTNESVKDNGTKNNDPKNKSTELTTNNTSDNTAKSIDENPVSTAGNESKTNNEDPLNTPDKSKNNDVVLNNNEQLKTADESKSPDAAVSKTNNNEVANDQTKNVENDQPTNIVNDKVNSGDKNLSNTAENPVSPASNSTIALPVTEKFELTNKPVYTASNPIPVNEKLPDGLIYKIQIGAFRNPIDPEQFKGMTPLTAETTAQGLTRYTAGLFTKFETADKVKNEIRELGYKDAFVVGFYNGKRISTAEAIQMGGAPGLATNDQTKNLPENKSGNSTLTNTTKTNDQNPSLSSKDIAATENINVVSGLFYTVQVGVFSQPVTSAKLFNIQPLYTETAANGNLRYNTGIYNNVSRANEARAIVFNAGVKDAFVTAYYQGKRISLPEAKQLEQQGSAVFTTAANVNQFPIIFSGAQTSVTTNTNKEVSTSRSNPVTNNENEKPVIIQNEQANNELKTTIEQNMNAVPDTGLVFKIQIGAFKDEVPLEIANQFLKVANKGIKNYKDEKGLTIYTLGVFKMYEDASRSKGEIVTIVTDAFIVAYNNGKKISIDEAKALQNK